MPSPLTTSWSVSYSNNSYTLTFASTYSPITWNGWDLFTYQRSGVNQTKYLDLGTSTAYTTLDWTLCTAVGGTSSFANRQAVVTAITNLFVPSSSSVLTNAIDEKTSGNGILIGNNSDHVSIIGGPGGVLINHATGHLTEINGGTNSGGVNIGNDSGYTGVVSICSGGGSNTINMGGASTFVTVRGSVSINDINSATTFIGTGTGAVTIGNTTGGVALSTATLSGATNINTSGSAAVTHCSTY